MNFNCSMANTQASQLWQSVLQLPPFDELEQLFSLSDFDNLLHADTLNALKTAMGNTSKFEFVCQQQSPPTEIYYEEIIYTHAQIPTRPNSWHDLFNGLIWLQFPKTKALLNRWHVEDIQTCGLNPRTPRRNQITHFDECGVIIVCEEPQMVSDLREHLFKSTLYAQRAKWGKQIQATVFGHANYEMLLKPYIGLTGKWLPITPCKDYFAMPKLQQLNFIDEVLSAHLTNQTGFCQHTRLSPLPLLGVPGWWPDNTQSQFYDNTDYFRPKTIKKKDTSMTLPE